MARETEFHRIMRVRDNFLQEVTNYCLLGATNEQLAEFFDISISHIRSWSQPSSKHRIAEFADAMNAGRVAADAQVAVAMHKRATGYEYESQRVVITNGHGSVLNVTEHVPPDTNAGKFWLTNRDARWREKQTLEHSGRDGGAIETEMVVKFVAAAPPTPPMLNVTPANEQIE